MAKRPSCGQLQSIHKKYSSSAVSEISIDHTFNSDYKRSQKLLAGKTFGDSSSDIKFTIGSEEIASHSEVLEILSNQRQLIKDLIERDRQVAKQQKCSEANIFQLSGTTPNAFKLLLNYIYNGKLKCDLKNGIDLALTAIKLKFHPLVASIAQQLAFNINDCLRCETVDDLYHIAKNAENKKLAQECSEFMDRNAAHLNALYLKRDDRSNDDKNVLTYSFDKSRFCNYVHFLLPDSTEVCFNIFVSNDRKNWTLVLQNEEIWCRSWNWVYFKERRIKYIRIVCTEQEDDQFNIKDIRDDQFLCKKANVDLEFDRQYLIPKHDIIKYPIYMTKHHFDKEHKNGFTYCTSDAPIKEKEKFYFYHRVGDGKPLEFYLPQTCLIDSFRMRLWDLDDRTYDFTVEVRNNDEEEWHLISNQGKDVFDKRSSWQTIHFGSKRIVRWIKITGIKAPPNDPEFAVIHFECPPQNKSR